MKKLFILLALVMSFTMALTFTAFAVEGGDTITISKGTLSTLDGQVFSAYKIFDLTKGVDSEGEDTYAYILNSAYAGFTDYSPSDSLAEYIKGCEKDDAALFALSVKLMEYILSEGITADATATGADGDDVVIDGLDRGYYLVTGSGVKDYGNDETVVVESAYALVSTGDSEAGVPDIVLKADAPDINKWVWNQHDEFVDDEWQEWIDVSIGDTVNFMFDSMKVPDLRGYTAYTFIIHDDMYKGLTFDPTTVVVTIGDNTLTEVDDYDVVFPADDDCTFDIVFRTDLFFEYETGDKIEVLFSATLNGDAMIGPDGNPNEVQLEFSNTPYPKVDGEGKPTGDDTGRTPWHKVIVYTGVLEILKYTKEQLADESYKKNPLAGAKFILKRGESEVALVLVTLGDVTEPTVYRPAMAGETPVDEMTTPESGLIRIEGLGASYATYTYVDDILDSIEDWDDFGDYSLVETASPEGYNKLEADITSTLYFDHAKKQWYILDGDGNVFTHLEIENNAGNRFPDTGGIGRIIIYIVGTAIVVGAGATLMIRRRINLVKK